MPPIWLLDGDIKEEEGAGDALPLASDLDKAVNILDLDKAVTVLAQHVPVELMDPVAVRNYLKEKFQAKSEETDKPQEVKGVAEEEEKDEKDEGSFSNTLSLVEPTAASDVAADLGDIEMGDSNKAQVKKEDDDEEAKPGDGEVTSAAKSSTNQKGVNEEWLTWLKELEETPKLQELEETPTIEGPRKQEEEEMTKKAKQEEEQMAEKAIEAISTAIVEAVSPAVVEQEDSYNKFGTMVSCYNYKI